MQSLIDVKKMQTEVINPLVASNIRTSTDIQSVLFDATVRQYDDFQPIIDECLMGSIILHMDGEPPVTLRFGAQLQREFKEPITEYQVYGSQIMFIDDMSSNIGLMRKFIKSPRFKVNEITIGSISHTKVSIVYIEGVASQKILQDIRHKLSQVKGDSLISSGQISRALTDYPYSLIPMVRRTERPDQVTYALNSGKVAIFVDNNPFVLLTPNTFLDWFQLSEDHIESIWYGYFVRTIRLISLILVMILPAFYVALVGFNPELIPTRLALSIAKSRNEIPFPIVFEAVILSFAMDVIIEASMRLPRYIGPTIGIVGGLVIGQATVEAGIISSTMIIVVAFTSIASFTSPSWEMMNAWRIFRYLLLAFVAFFGLYGVVLGGAGILMYLCHLHTKAKSYMVPVGALYQHDGTIEIK